MPRVRAGAASIPGGALTAPARTGVPASGADGSVRPASRAIHDPRRWRAEDRVLCGEHAWAILTGTTNQIDGENEADAAVHVADALVGSPEPPSLDAIEACFVEMGRVAGRWASQHRGDVDDVWWPVLGAVVLVLSEGAARIAHVGRARAYRLFQAGPTDPLIAEALTIDHSVAEVARRRSDGAAVHARGSAEDILTSSLVGPADRIDFTRIALSRGSRLVLVSPGARRGLDTPLGYLRELRAPAELAQRICAEGRSRAGERAHHASAIVIDVDVDSTPSAYR